jgi:hypothetical protein
LEQIRYIELAAKKPVAPAIVPASGSTGLLNVAAKNPSDPLPSNKVRNLYLSSKSKLIIFYLCYLFLYLKKFYKMSIAYFFVEVDNFNCFF